MHSPFLADYGLYILSLLYSGYDEGVIKGTVASDHSSLSSAEA
jgi:hypothetical protein